MIHVRDLQYSDLNQIKTMELRESDKREARAYTGFSPNDALALSCRISEYTKVVTEDSDIIAVFGISLEYSFGIPWFVATDRVEKHKLKWLRTSREAVTWMLDINPVLWNCVAKENTDAIRWLEWLGFTIDKGKEWIFFDENIPFYEFYQRRQ